MACKYKYHYQKEICLGTKMSCLNGIVHHVASDNLFGIWYGVHQSMLQLLYGMKQIGGHWYDTRKL